MQEPDDTSYHAVVNPLLPGLLSKELCTLAPGQVLSPIQRQVQAPQERQPSGGDPVWERRCEFRQHCSCVCMRLCLPKHTG